MGERVVYMLWLLMAVLQEQRQAIIDDRAEQVQEQGTRQERLKTAASRFLASRVGKWESGKVRV